MTLPQRDRTNAQRIRVALDAIYAVSMAHGDECGRVLNLGIPLTDMIEAGMIDRLSPDGQDDLSMTADTLESWLAHIRRSPENVTADVNTMWRILDIGQG